VYGGQTSTGGFLNDLWRWNPATETWTQLANMPTAKGNIQGAYWNGKIYVPGGFAAGVHITENAIYDIATNTWMTGAPLPAPQSGQDVAFNNKIYNFGGNPGPQSAVTIYDIATNTWSNGEAMPVPNLWTGDSSRPVRRPVRLLRGWDCRRGNSPHGLSLRLCGKLLGNDGAASDSAHQRGTDDSPRWPPDFCRHGWGCDLLYGRATAGVS
jgi:hypothetical protein